MGRTCLQTINVGSDQLYNESLDMYLGQVNREIDAFITMGGREILEGSVHETSHKIILMDPLKHGLSYTPRFTTRWIAYRVYEKMLQRSQQYCFLLYKHLSQQENLRSAAGWFFESYVHDRFRQGGTFRADAIPIKEPGTLFDFTIKKSISPAPNYFKSAEDLAKIVRDKHGKGIDPKQLQQYFLPYSRNQASIDSLVFTDAHTLVMFQITLATEHEIKVDGITELLRALPTTIRNIYIVFVIPDNRIQHYSKRQTMPGATALLPGCNKLHIKQFRLAFTDDQIKAVSAQGPFQLQEADMDQYSSSRI